MKLGRNVFITGSAGVGKSFVIELYYKMAVKKHGHEKVFKTSTTGVSAVLIGGRTLHSWSGILLGDKPVFDLIERMSPEKMKIWKSAKVLFIDEISMLNHKIFDKLNTIGKILRNSPKPFGGIQVIITGDFYQLPAVKTDLFCFESKYWNEVINKTVYLKEIVRQKDEKFAKLLDEIRIGQCSDEADEILRSRVGVELTNEYGIKPTELYPKNKEADIVNRNSLKKLLNEGKESHDYKATYKFMYNKTKVNNNTLLKWRKNDMKYLIPDDIKLAVGAQVVFKRNISPEIANGTRAVVKSFVKIENELEPGRFQILPVVTLLNGSVVVVERIDFSYEIYEEFSINKYQIPLKLAWASTIHSCQGMTLDYVKADVGVDIFEYGQAYVVLSRVKNIEGLSLINYSRDVIMAHPKVLKEYNDYSFIDPEDLE